MLPRQRNKEWLTGNSFQAAFPHLPYSLARTYYPDEHEPDRHNHINNGNPPGARIPIAEEDGICSAET
jgi:hypothetical protein